MKFLATKSFGVFVLYMQHQPDLAVIISANFLFSGVAIWCLCFFVYWSAFKEFVKSFDLTEMTYTVSGGTLNPTHSLTLTLPQRECLG